MIDLRSDTVTKPSRAMRQAIADAVVGDDVYGDDPTVNELERTVAALLGKEDAVFVPTGTMSNQIALRTHTEPGDTVVLHEEAHIVRHELGGAAHNSGVTLAQLAGPYGSFTADQLRASIPNPSAALPSHMFDPVTLVCLENTHNDSGGTVWDLDQMQSVLDTAAELDLRTHLDGARLWNAAAASGTDLADLTAGFDTVNVCFSKGLGAPVGSALAGDAATISRARRFKQIFGGGFRQAGILAAGALFALEHNRERLTDDHLNARAFAESINESELITVDLDSAQTNLVYFEADGADELAAECLARGVSMLAVGPATIRAVFHMDVTADEASNAADTVKSAVEAQRLTSGS
ncbi:MAG: aminotransferase class I/II-fold pyridoxal phosphate-dependent enzyme [Actinomycetia bacterium]|nr:aminotransferase class I/II-fold pyridoxal phosphate-dependent enzyme [Actinomycetes bacterium]